MKVIKIACQILIFLVFNIKGYSDGILSPKQAAYDVKYYDLDLVIDPITKTIKGSLLCNVLIVNQLDTLEFDLDSAFNIDSI